MLLVRGDEEHVGAILAGAHNPVDLGGCGVVASDDLCAFGGKPDFSSHQCEAMGAVQGSCVDVGQRLLRDQVDDGKGVIAAAAIDGNVCGLSIGRCDDFMRIGANRGARNHLQGVRIDNGECVIALGKCQQ